MISVYNEKYYTIDLIPQHRHEYINLKLEWFINLFNLKNTDWPLDCALLIKKMKELQLIPFDYGFFELPTIYDALTEYKCKYDVYLMQINKNKAKYPYKHSHVRRLNNIKRLDLLRSRRISTCNVCGNTNFSLFSEFCGICGNPVRNRLNGFKRVYYPDQIKLDKYKSVLECPTCKSDGRYVKGDRCTVCGTYIFNYCSDYLKNIGDCTNSNPGNSRFCEMCGKPTYFLEKGFLDPWQEEVDNDFSNIHSLFF